MIVTPLYNVLESTIKLPITSNLETLKLACFKEFCKDIISTHEFFHSTSLYAGYRKETF